MIILSHLSKLLSGILLLVLAKIIKPFFFCILALRPLIEYLHHKNLCMFSNLIYYFINKYNMLNNGIFEEICKNWPILIILLIIKVIIVNN